MSGLLNSLEATTDDDELDDAATDALNATEVTDRLATEVLNVAIAVVDEPEADELETASGAGCPAAGGGEYGVRTELPGTFGL